MVATERPHFEELELFLVRRKDVHQVGLFNVEQLVTVSFIVGNCAVGEAGSEIVEELEITKVRTSLISDHIPVRRTIQNINTTLLNKVKSINLLSKVNHYAFILIESKFEMPKNRSNEAHAGTKVHADIGKEVVE